jgi:Cu-Zn family superoxide dismutase
MTRAFVTVAVSCAILTGAGSVPRAASAAPPPTYGAYIIDTTGKEVGSATFIGVDTGGVEIHVDVSGLTPGLHGMHIHANGSCNALRDTTGKVTPFGAAGPHFDPQGAEHHLGPSGAGHAGDLPNIEADLAGHAVTTFYVDRLSVAQGPTNIVGRAIVIHANEDNYTDVPPNGGSGARVECGEIGALRS